MMVSPGGCTAPQNFGYFAIDNGAFSAYNSGKEWNGEAFMRYLSRMLEKGTPDFIVTPDKVAKGLESLAFSVEWARKLRASYPDLRQFLEVQDGMTEKDVELYLPLFDGVFVGGSLEWKYQTAEQWVEFAHKHGMLCHIGRVGTWDKIVWAMRIGADSIDSSSWAQNDSWHHIEAAKAQRMLEAVE